MVAFCVLSVGSQVLRHSRYRVGSVGTDVTKVDVLAWSELQQRFFSGKHCGVQPAGSQLALCDGEEHGPHPREEKKAHRRQKLTVPRLATYDWLCALHNALEQGTGSGLERFAGAAQKLAKNEVPAVLSLCMDQEQKQWTAVWFMMFGPPKLCMVAVPDPYHRRHNDIQHAMARSGLYGHFVRKIIEFNLSYGPWQSAGWMRDIEDAVLDVQKTLTPSDPLLLRLWPAICKDNGWHDFDDQSAAARKDFLEMLPHREPFTDKGPQVSASRWMSWQKAHRFHDPHHHTKLLVFIFICMRKGWVQTWEDIWAPDALIGTPCALDSSIAAAAAAPSQPAMASTQPVPAGENLTQAAAKARAQKKASLAKFKNTFVSVTKGMADSEFLFGTRLLGELTEGEAKAHGAMAQTMRSAESGVQHYIAQSQWEVLRELDVAINALSNGNALERMGLTVSFQSTRVARIRVGDPDVGCEDAQAELCCRFVGELLRQRCGSMMWHTAYYPGLLAPLLSSDPAAVELSMAVFKKHTLAFRAAASCQVSEVTQMHKRCVLQGEFFQACIHFAEKSEWQLSRELNELVAAIFRGFLQTKMNEDANQKIRDRETRACANKVQQHCTQWSVPIKAEVLADYERTEIKANWGLPRRARRDPRLGHIFQKVTRGVAPQQQQAEGNRKRKRSGATPVPDGAAPNESVPDGAAPSQPWSAVLKKVMGSAGWWSPSAQSQRKAWGELQLMATLHETSSWHLADEVWRTHFVPVGEWVIMGSQLVYVVESFGCAVLGWKATKVHGKHFSWATELKKLEWFHLFTFEACHVVATKVTSPLYKRIQLGADAPLGAVSFMSTEANKVPVLQWQAARAFPGVPECQLRQLHRQLALASSPDEVLQEEDVILALMRSVTKDLSEEAAYRALCGRKVKDVGEDWALADIHAEEVRDVVVVKDAKDVEDAKKGQTQQRLREKVLRKRARIAVTNHFAAKPMTAKAKAMSKPAYQDPVSESSFRNFQPGTQMAFMKRWAPAGGTIVEDNPNGRYLAAYPNAGRVSVSWTRRGSQDTARMVLQWLWARHTRHTGEDPPFPTQWLSSANPEPEAQAWMDVDSPE